VKVSKAVCCCYKCFKS